MNAPRPQIGLMLSCGEPPGEGKRYPTKLDYIRPKRGAVDQFAGAAAKFSEVYGDRPRVIDITFLSDSIGENLDVRPLIFGTSGLKARGVENLADYPPAEFGDRIRAFDWELQTFPDDKPEPGSYTVDGREDAVVTRLGLKVYASLYVSIPDVLGIAMVAAISTTSTRTMTNWFDALWRMSRLTGGVLVGIPCVLMLRPARGRYWDPKADGGKGKRKVADFQEWVIDSHHSARELYEFAAERRAAVGPGTPTLELPPPPAQRRAVPLAEVKLASDLELDDLPDFEEVIDPAEFDAPELPDDEIAEALDG